MKKFIFLSISTILMIFLLGCDGENSLPPYSYDLRIRFEDQYGNNLVKGLADVPDSAVVYDWFEVSLLEYQQTVTGASSWGSKTPLYVVMDNARNEELLLQYSTFDEVSPVITHNLKCKHIFGNYEEHVIVSYWEKASEPFSTTCLKVTFDGKEYPVTNNKDYQAEVLIKIDRP